MSERGPQFEVSADRSALEEQYEHPRVVDVDGTPLEIYDLRPDVLKTNIPAMVVPGVGADVSLLRETMLGLAAKGRRIIAGSAVHGVPTERSGLHPEIEYRKSEAVARTLNELGIDQVDIVGHSEASLIVGVASLHDDERFRNLLFVNPAGVHQPDGAVTLLGRSLNELGRSTLHELSGIANDKITAPLPPTIPRMSNVFSVTLRSIIENPKLIWNSFEAGGTMDISPLLKELRAKGHRVSIIHGVDDEMLPMDRVQDFVTPDMVDGFYSVKGGHTELFAHPEKFNTIIDEALDALEKK